MFLAGSVNYGWSGLDPVRTGRSRNFFSVYLLTLYQYLLTKPMIYKTFSLMFSTIFNSIFNWKRFNIEIYQVRSETVFFFFFFFFFCFFILIMFLSSYLQFFFSFFFLLGSESGFESRYQPPIRNLVYPSNRFHS